VSVQNIFALPNEVFVTLLASVTVALITAYQIIALMRGKGSADASSEAEPSPAVLAQVVYGLLVCVGFAWWTINLSTIGLYNWALVSVCFALLGLVMPVVVWQQATKNGAGNSVPTTAPADEASPFVEYEDSGLAPALASLATLSENVDEISEADAICPVIAASEPATLSAVQAVKPVATANPVEFEWVSPTDSILKRHYQQWLAAQNTLPEPTPAVLQQPRPAAPRPVQAAPVSNTAVTPDLPQDSVLRRHTLGIMRAQIEASLPDRPSDSVLKRHYSQLLASALAKHPLL